MSRHGSPHTIKLLMLFVCAVLLAGCGAVDAQTVRNVAEYQVRKALPPVLVYREPPAPASLSGVVRDQAGQPIVDAIVLVSTVRGEAVHTRSDANGRYRLDGIAPGRATPMAAAWGYDAVNGNPLRLRAGQAVTGVDFALRTRRPEPMTPLNLRVGQPVLAPSNFPESMVATRIPFTFTLDGVTVDVGQIYLPANPPAEPLPTLFIVYPSRPLNWDAASVGLTRDGYSVLAVGPDGDRGLDMAGHMRDLRAAMQLWVDGELPLAPPDDNWALLSGSFGSLIVFPALQDLPVQPPRIVDIGGVSDAFLGVQSLYSVDLAIPPPYDNAVAALGRPDRDPAFFYAFSPALYAEYLPPTFVVHMLNDPVIPHNQAAALIDALAAAGVPHESLLYEDTTHYLDAYNPTPATGMVFERVLAYVRAMGDTADR